MEENDPQALNTSVDPVSVIKIIDRDELRAMLPAMLPRLWAFALRLSGGRRCAEEILRLACARALELIRHMHPGSGLIGWLFSIVHRTWIYDIRPHKPRGNSPNWDVNSLQGLTAGDTDDSKTQSDLSCQRILMAVNVLPESQRETMLLVAIERFSYEEAATILQLPVGEVIKRISQARQTIGALRISCPLNE